ncbi:MAG: exodeoxyribonuclease VII small subunit [Defluviitaleaceae bacterium]|nr:exodeoxyribonuclease VII small subunit [Defluviitaleaceae bacterium]
MTFELSIEKLAVLTEAIESPATPLDEALALYKEGIALAKECGEALSGYEAEIMVLQKEADGVFALNPFGEDLVDND